MRNHLVEKHIKMNAILESYSKYRITMLRYSFNNPYVPGTHFYFRLFLQFSSFYVFRLIRPLPQSFQEDHNRL